MFAADKRMRLTVDVAVFCFVVATIGLPAGAQLFDYAIIVAKNTPLPGAGNDDGTRIAALLSDGTSVAFQLSASHPTEPGLVPRLGPRGPTLAIRRRTD